MAVGFPTKVDYATGDVLSADNMNDLSGTVNLLESAQYAAGVNKIINGDFGVWQRGTTFTSGFGGGYNVDRWKSYTDTAGATITVSRESLNNAIAGLNTPYFWQWNQTVAGSGGTVNYITQAIENVETLANQNVVLSFYMKANTTTAIQTPVVVQRFGSGGSGAVTVTLTPVGTNPANITTAWQRFAFTATVPSVAGKTIGAGSLLEINLKLPINSVFTIGIVGVQLEAASTASPFQTATGTIQGELAACRRYLPTVEANSPLLGFSSSTSRSYMNVKFDVQARVAPTGVTIPALSNFTLYNAGIGSGTPTGLTFNAAGASSSTLIVDATVGSPPQVQGQSTMLFPGASGYILFTGCEL
jgi:hypothetical protein